MRSSREIGMSRSGAGAGRHLGPALIVLVAVLMASLTGASFAAGGTDGHGSGHAKNHWIAKKIRGMSLAEKVGQLFVANVYGERADTSDPEDVAANQAMYGPAISNANQLIDRYKLGGVIYFRWTNNLNEPTQIARLSNGIQTAALRQRARIPMLISTDQEHGVVSRVWAPATEFPGNMALGATRRPRDSYAAARTTAKELAAIGINQNYAPVADVNINPLNPVIGVRSFGENPASNHFIKRALDHIWRSTSSVPPSRLSPIPHGGRSSGASPTVRPPSTSWPSHFRSACRRYLST